MLAGAVAATAALIGSLVLAAPAAAVPTAAPAAVDTGIVQAAAVAGFNPENIISDALFYDGNAMSSAEIQAFLDAKIGSCSNGKCLNVLNVSISSRDAWYSAVTGDLVCSALQGGTMRTSELIYRVQVACGISAKAILVTLQKEQGLTTSSAPSDWNLQAAMGASCPDTSPCDPAYSGVGPQIVQGVRQLKIYKAGRFAKQPGVNFIGYSPNAACGGTNLNIQNYATAALYNYTPYQPNAASLAAGWGLGDGCSSYGNRNFFNYYTSWFGSTQIDIATARAAITARWSATGGAGGGLGAALGTVICGTRDGGCYQNFQGGAISWTASTGAWETTSGIRARWGALSFENGVLGYPVGPPTCGMKDGGCYQNFQGGAISWSPSTGSWETTGVIRARWQALSFENGVLGYPIGGVTCGAKDGGCYQNFQGGAISWTAATGAWETFGGIRIRWAAAGYESGTLGYPTGAQISGNGLAFQPFQGGAVGWSASGGTFVSTGAIAARWTALGGTYGSLGAPLTDIVCGTKDGGCYQNFQNGAISWTPATGAWETSGAIRDRWKASGFEGGVLGYPTAAPVSTAAGISQTFQNGAIGWSNDKGALLSTGVIGARWVALNAVTGALGAPVGEIVCGTRSSGCYQNFQKGAISSTSATGTWETYGVIRARWQAIGFESGVLGYPVGAPTCGTKDNGCYQNFENGAISWTAMTGAWETYGVIRAFWRAQDFERGALGYPLGAPATDGQGSSSQLFQGGVVTVGSGGTSVSPKS